MSKFTKVEQEMKKKGWAHVWLGRVTGKVFARDNSKELNSIVVFNNGRMIVTNSYAVVDNKNVETTVTDQGGIPTVEEAKALLKERREQNTF